MANINLFLFYGVDGDLHFPRLFAGIDIALLLAVLNILFFIYLYGAVLAEYLQPFWTKRAGYRKKAALSQARGALHSNTSL
jgi:hypothetical protein